MDKQITVREATLRDNNMLWIAYMAITTAAVVERLIGEDNLVNRLDEAAIILLAITGLVWYFGRRNRYQHSFAPLALIIATFIVQAACLTACTAAPRIVEPGSPAATATPQQPVPTAAIPVVSSPTPASVLTGSSPAIAFKPANEVEGLTIEKTDGELWLKVFSQQEGTDNPAYWVTGKAPAGTQISVNGSTYRTGPDQRFSIDVGLDDGPNEIAVIARNDLGEEVTIHLFVFYNQAP